MSEQKSRVSDAITLRKGEHYSKRGAFLPVCFAMLGACSTNDIPLLNPVGDVGADEARLFYISVTIMAAIIIPVILLTFYFAWRYRASGKDKGYDPAFDHSPVIDGVTLFIPLLTIAVLGGLTWIYTHRLDPYKPRGPDLAPYEIQAISLDYKWLFIYPEEGVATVNDLVAPTGRPVTLRLTSDPMMTSIFIPGLISQIYAMPGMETRANFLADRQAILQGSNAMYSGPGFEHQRFKARMVAPEDFESWVYQVKSGAGSGSGGANRHEAVLDKARLAALVKRSENNPVTWFAAVEPGLFEGSVQKYMPHYSMKPLPSRSQYDGKMHVRETAGDAVDAHSPEHMQTASEGG
ncbi:MAG: COX aromatic rich motif-containing protein [Sphingomonadaceae bacterium]